MRRGLFFLMLSVLVFASLFAAAPKASAQGKTCQLDTYSEDSAAYSTNCAPESFRDNFSRRPASDTYRILDGYGGCDEGNFCYATVAEAFTARCGENYSSGGSVYQTSCFAYGPDTMFLTTCPGDLVEVPYGGCGESSVCCGAETSEEAGDKLDSFSYCDQVPNDGQRDACITCVGGDPGNKVYTAVGCISTSGSALAGDLIRLFLGVSGGVALLSILGAAFIFSTSQGDTNKVKKAKELMTAAVSGLFFIIFSVIILNFIGVEILKIPGLG